MPANKNQHYVPRCYLKPFTLNGKGLAINLVNINSNMSIPNAPTKGQCAKDYLYGKDLKLENRLKYFESRYAVVLKKLQNEEDLALSELEELRSFAWLQHNRTLWAFHRLSKAKEAAYEASHRGLEVRAEAINISEETSMLHSMDLFKKTLHTISDLKVCILHNQTHTDFVTSDDPAILTNRFHMQRLQTDNVGTGSAGALLFLPLTPRHMLVCYDADIYFIKSINGRFVLTRKADALIFNQLQYIKAQKNIYHLNLGDSRLIVDELRQATPLKPPSWHIIQTAIITREESGKTFIRKATPEEAILSERRVVTQQNVLPKPAKWPSIIQYKLKPKYFYDGSLAGYLRIAAAQKMYMRAKLDLHNSTVF